MSRTVDEITGYEMLEFFRLTAEQRYDRGFEGIQSRKGMEYYEKWLMPSNFPVILDLRKAWRVP